MIILLLASVLVANAAGCCGSTKGERKSCTFPKAVTTPKGSVTLTCKCAKTGPCKELMYWGCETFIGEELMCEKGSCYEGAPAAEGVCESLALRDKNDQGGYVDAYPSEHCLNNLD